MAGNFFFKFLILSLLTFLSSFASPLKLELSAKAAILINSETGAVLYEKNAHLPLYPASITKMVTALYALEKKEHALEEQVEALFDAVCAVYPHVRRRSEAHPPYRLEFGGSHMGIKAGEKLSFRVLLYGLMLVSGNDAANVIAHFVSGSIPEFMKELNLYVQSKGCKNTKFYTPHGLPHPEHKTTAYDMALLAREALKKPLLREIVKTVSYTRPQTHLQPQTTMYQHNALIKPGSKFYYPKAIGIKTGFTSAGGYTLIAAAEDEKRKLIAVLLGCEHLDARYKDAIALFEAAFNEKKAERILFSKEFDTFNHKIKGGKTLLKAELKEDARLSFYESENHNFSSKIVWDVNTLPIAQGQNVGKITIFSREEKMLEVPLFARHPVEPTFHYLLHSKWQSCKKVFSSYIGIFLAFIGGAIVMGCYFIFHRKA